MRSKLQVRRRGDAVRPRSKRSMWCSIARCSLGQSWLHCERECLSGVPMGVLLLEADALLDLERSAVRR